MSGVASAIWLGLLLAIFFIPFLTHSSTLGDNLVRNTIRLALLYYGAAATLMLLLKPVEWSAASGRGRLARWCWTLAWAAYLVHVGLAFHYYHHWSHAEAVEHTLRVSGLGEGVFVSYLFTVAWSIDVAYWWLRPRGYANRPAWLGRALHLFMLLMIFNATVVYETGAIRWAGIALCGELTALWLCRGWLRRHRLSA